MNLTKPSLFEFTITDPDKAIKWKKNDHYGLSDIMFPTARKREKIKKMGISMIYNDYTTSASPYNIITYLSYSKSGPVE